MKPTWTVAHRGGALLAPENTIQAFAKAIDLGADALELDVHLSADGHLVVIHDETLQRTSGKDGVVKQLRLAQIQSLDPSIPSLVEVLQLARGRCKVIVECKCQDLEVALVSTLRKEDMVDQVVVISFHPTTLQRIRQLHPKIETGFLFGRQGELEILKQELAIDWLGPHHALVDSHFVQQARALGLKVNPWTVNQEAEMDRLIALGCEAITTDRPDLLLQRLRRPPKADDHQLDCLEP